VAIHNALKTSNSNTWETPKSLFDELDKEFNFTLDVAASYENRKCKEYYCEEAESIGKSGLDLDWHGSVWCNPPYSRGLQNKFIKKANREYYAGNVESIVVLLPARTDTLMFHEYVYKKRNVELRFLKGRLKFEVGGVASKNPAPFPSMLVIFK